MTDTAPPDDTLRFESADGRPFDFHHLYHDRISDERGRTLCEERHAPAYEGFDAARERYDTLAALFADGDVCPRCRDELAEYYGIVPSQVVKDPVGIDWERNA